MGTGIAPFVYPAAPKQGRPIFEYLIVGIIWPVRALLILVTLFIWALEEIVTWPLYFVSPWVHGIVLRIPVCVNARFILLLLGYLNIRTESVLSGRRRGNDPKPGWGDVIVSNWSSYVDVLYYAFRYNAVFLKPTCDKTGKISWNPVGALRMIGECGKIPKETHEIAKSTRVPGRVNVLFFEGTTSNNRCILDWRAENISWCEIVFASCIKHDKPEYLRRSVTKPAPGFAYLSLLAASFARLRHLDVYVSSAGRPADVVSIFERPGRLSRVKLSWRDKQAFLNFDAGKR